MGFRFAPGARSITPAPRTPYRCTRLRGLATEDSHGVKQRRRGLTCMEYGVARLEGCTSVSGRKGVLIAEINRPEPLADWFLTQVTDRTPYQTPLHSAECMRNPSWRHKSRTKHCKHHDTPSSTRRCLCRRSPTTPLAFSSPSNMEPIVVFQPPLPIPKRRVRSHTASSVINPSARRSFFRKASPVPGPSSAAMSAHRPPRQHAKWTKGDFELVSNDGVKFRTHTYHLQSAS